MPPRLVPDRPFPAYAFVPGRHPHPETRHGDAADAADGQLPYALDLFNHGYYWEAHEIWETLWQARERDSTEGQLLQGLIALAAAGVKAREGNLRGVTHHARRAETIFKRLGAGLPILLGHSLAALAAFAEGIAERPPCYSAEPGAPPMVVFGVPLTLA